VTFRQAFAPWAAGGGAPGMRQRVTSNASLGADRVDVAVVAWGLSLYQSCDSRPADVRVVACER